MIKQLAGSSVGRILLVQVQQKYLPARPYKKEANVCSTQIEQRNKRMDDNATFQYSPINDHPKSFNPDKNI